MKLSVVATLYRSAPYLEEFLRRVTEQALALGGEHEIVLVDDGSPDDSLEKALQLQKKYPSLTVIELSRNFGHHKAIMTGLEHARGENVFLIDTDLEEPPELLSKFYQKMQEGTWDVVYGIQSRRSGNFVKRVGGWLGWGMIKAMLTIPVPRDQSTARLMKRDYVRQLVRHKEHRTAIGGLWVLTGFRQTPVLFERASRNSSSYSFFQRVHALIDSVTSFSEKPLYAVFFLGCSMFALSFMIAVYLIIRRFTGAVLSGWVSVMVSVWALSGLILLCLGLVGIYVSRVFIETKNRPYVIVRQIHSGGHEPS